ncbi:DNA helicase RecQ [Agarilytica rhodophyticola]|uniref:DNA helicase RecQ n=1 Tax=Agarilytica rhodophyticola TaxID=1737490 RepID=UPI000B347FD4|nr:DNA helicase RecQ [Agarilytica rhodophyticola]
MVEALHVLNHTFGFSSFRDQQGHIVDAVIRGKNTLVVMPTGGGKSLCYQIPALVREGMGIVISPLIALMQDQVSALNAHGLQAAFLNSTLSLTAMQDLERRIVAGNIDILYVAPERLIQARTINLLQQVKLSLFAIDEAHCLAQWGHDFRSDYLRLDVLPQSFPHVPRVALTATADRKTQHEIARCLQLDQDAQFVCGFDRSNIQYRIQQKNRPKKQLLSFLKEEQKDSAGIVYCLSRKKVEDTALWLQHEGFTALPYHAGMDTQSRQRHQDRFLREDGIIIVATIAFGMGIDKPNVRFVAHLDMPKSIEAYYQETGRAGRDGENATAILFYGMEDVVKLSQMAANSEGNEEFKRHERHRLNAMLGLCEMTSCRRQALLHYFDDSMDTPCGNCDNCIQPPQTRDATEDIRKALSCVYRTGQRFGAVHVIDVLRGSDNEKVRQFSHQTLSTYGIGKDLSTDAWRTIFRQLIVMGFLDVDASAYGNLRLTEKSRPILRGEQSIHLRYEIKVNNTKRSHKIRDDIDQENMALWNDLRACRKQLALENGVPPYIIFSDATLKEMIVYRPLNSSQLIEVNGVGDKKLEQFGEAFLDVIRNHEYA